MLDFFLKHKKVVISLSLILAVSAFGVFIFGTGEAKAATFAEKVSNAMMKGVFGMVTGFITVIGAVFTSIFSIIFYLASMLLEMAFGLEKFTDVSIVETGWGITRDVANMLFVIGLIIIAGATALKIDSYDVKKLLPKLIIAALLINFSLIIAGVIIDFTQVATHFFYEEVASEMGFTEQLAKVMKISSSLSINENANAGEKLAAGAAGILMLIFTQMASIFFLFLASIAVGIGAFFLIIRMIILWILLILAPMAWAMSVLPATEHLFKKWWNDFLKWSFFAPVYAFFVYLAVKATNSDSFANIINDEMASIVEATGWKETFWNGLMSSPNVLMQFLAATGFLFGGVIVAQKLGIYGAAGIIKMAQSAREGAGDWAKRKALSTVARPAGWAGEKLRAASEQMGWAGRLTGAKALMRQGGRGARSIEEAERAATRKEEEKYKDYTTDNLQRTSMAVDGRAKVAIAQLLAKKKAFKENKKTGYTREEIQKAIKLAQRHGQEGDLMSARPDIAASTAFNAAPLGKKDEAAKAALEKYVSFTKDGLSKIQSESLGGDNPDFGQAAVHKFIQESVTEKGGKMKPSTLPKLTESSPALYNHIIEKIVKPIYQNQPKLKKFETDRPDMTGYIGGNAGKVLGIV